MLKYIGVALKLGSKKSNQLLKDLLISFSISCGEGRGCRDNTDTPGVMTTWT